VRIVRRVISTVLMSVLLAAGVAATGLSVTVASAATPQANTYCADGQTLDCIQAPRSLVKGHQKSGEKLTTYCIKNYKGGSVVKIVNEQTGQVVSVTTAPDGTACTQVPVTTDCQQVTAHGPNQDGKPGHSTARVCVTATTTTAPPKGLFSGGLPFTGSNIIIPATILGLVLIGLGFFAVLVGRRRRDDEAEATA
jgi:hypothetical protein